MGMAFQSLHLLFPHQVWNKSFAELGVQGNCAGRSSSHQQRARLLLPRQSCIMFWCNRGPSSCNTWKHCGTKCDSRERVSSRLPVYVGRGVCIQALLLHCCSDEML